MECREFTVGQRVFFSSCVTGSSAEYTVCNPANTYPLPPALSFEEGACLGVPYLTAHRALFGKARGVAGQRVLVHGATGAVGIATVQLALAAGMHVVASSGSVAGVNLLLSQGVRADCIIMHRDPEHLKTFQIPGAGFDIIIEMLANENLSMDLKTLAQGGVVVVVGNRGDVSINPRDLMARDASVVGMSLANVKPTELKQIAQSLYPALGKMLHPVVRRVYALEDLAEAHEDVLKPGALGNLVVRISTHESDEKMSD
jgi:NADPH2:quinone reductase